ncbi:uncharacterized protein LY79DRAFT_240048 [Colletotrichum navitas]|uniref:Uncharacterized protein n=1 Tax=Colletotrichum navitas TaxID=681940 RepID=A0AAD8PXX7_9PEZI|nr:uncharacterized protein LY79DRAFT_240048 [Colletotrichum navitas]KAK1586109.1 hypothetical protein LY79DRAFT_240048 [Colletotrichum navitas]
MPSAVGSKIYRLYSARRRTDCKYTRHGPKYSLFSKPYRLRTTHICPDMYLASSDAPSAEGRNKGHATLHLNRLGSIFPPPRMSARPTLPIRVRGIIDRSSSFVVSSHLPNCLHIDALTAGRPATPAQVTSLTNYVSCIALLVHDVVRVKAN